MKMLFSSAERSEISAVRKRLFQAGIRCQVRNNNVAQGLFGLPSSPELWIERDGDILKALELVGEQRLQQMTVIFPRS